MTADEAVDEIHQRIVNKDSLRDEPDLDLSWFDAIFEAPDFEEKLKMSWSRIMDERQKLRNKN